MKKLILLYSFTLILNCNFNETSSENIDKNSSGNNEIPPSNFEGIWSNEGDVSATSKLIFEIHQIQNKIEGLIQFSSWDEENSEPSRSTPICSFTGDLSGGSGLIEILDVRQKNTNKYKAKIKKDGDYIIFESEKNGEGLFPARQIVWLYEEIPDREFSDYWTYEENKKTIKNNELSSNLLSLSEAVSSMRERAANSNQVIIEYFETEFEPGKTVYAFYLNSISKPGYSCVTALTPYSDEPIGVDCDKSAIKAAEWNNIPGSPKVLY